MGYEAINERVICIKINSRCILNIFLICASTSAAENDKVEQLYQTLETSLRNVPEKEICVILGDFNAKVGETGNDSHLRSVVVSLD